jgi:hypothetical protein
MHQTSSADDSRRGYLAVVVVLLLALGLRCGAAYWWNSTHGDTFPLGDSDSYWHLAGKIVDGKPYVYGDRDGAIFRAPGYPLLLATWFRLAGRSQRAARYLGAIFGTLGVGALMWLTDVTSGVGVSVSPGARHRGVLFVGVLAAFYPGAVSTSVLLLSESPFVPVMVSQLALWAYARNGSGRARYAFAAGCVGAIAALIRPSWLLFTPFSMFFFAVSPARPHRWRDLRIASVVLLGLCVGMTPWWIRNAREVGRFVPTTLQVGASLYDAWNPRATGGSDMWFSASTYRASRQRHNALPKSVRGSFEVYLDQQLKQEAVRWAQENPAQGVRIAAKRPLIMWNPWPRHNVMSGGWARHAIAFGFMGGFAAILWGGRKFALWQNPAELLWLPAAYFTLIHSVFVSSIRYRQPAVFAALPLAAACCWGVATLKRRHSSREDC